MGRFMCSSRLFALLASTRSTTSHRRRNLPCVPLPINVFDLTQAEAVADLIASNSKTTHDLAIKQMRGGFSEKIALLRESLVDFAALIELELDFSEEDVEFADRNHFFGLISELKAEISRLIESFQTGNVIKTGIPVAIIGKPNVGKSTLLNAILNEERALVSEIPGNVREMLS